MHTKIGKRTLCTILIVLVAIPILFFVFTAIWGVKQYYLTSLIFVGLVFLPFILRFEGKKPSARELVLLATMTALAVAGRVAFAWLPQCKPVCAIVILTGVALSPEAGFLTGASAALVSNFFFGQGPWTPWQMLGFGLVGFLGGLLFQGREIKRMPLLLYGFFSTLLLYGLLLDTASLLMFPSLEISWKALLVTYGAGFFANLVHAVSTVLFLIVLQKPILRKLERVKIKYGLTEVDIL